MSDEFIIQGQKSLEGEIEVRGSKNAAGPVLAAILLTDKECVIDNLPLVKDIFNMLDVLKDMGVKIDWLTERKVRVKADSLNPEKMDFEKISKTRISVLLFGALLARVRHFKISPPGGDRIGLRPISIHLKGLEKLGAKISRVADFYQVDCENLEGKEIVLGEFSVTATETLMLAAVLAKGKTIIKGAACEPHVRDLGKMLRNMGAKIEGEGTHIIRIEGVEKLNGVLHNVISDFIEAGTFIVAGAVTPGRVQIKNINLNDLDLFLTKLQEIGVNFEPRSFSEKKAQGESFITVSYSPNLRAAKVQSLPYPGFPTDLLPIVIPLLTKARGKSLIHDPLYENRFNYVHELRKMGADVEIVDPHRAFVFGPNFLKGVTIESRDIRAGACLIIAGLMAQGKTIIKKISQIDRGYEKIEERLQKLGADIKRVKN